MSKIIEQIKIQRKVEYVFKLAQDYNLRLHWDPFLENISFISDNKTLQRGLKVWVKAYNGMEMTVKYLNYNPPKHVSMKMLDGPFIFNSFSGLWKFQPLSSSSSLVTFKYNFSPKWFLFPATFVIRYILSKNMNKRLIALKKACESGEFDSRL